MYHFVKLYAKYFKSEDPIIIYSRLHECTDFHGLRIIYKRSEKKKKWHYKIMQKMSNTKKFENLPKTFKRIG